MIRVTNICGASPTATAPSPCIGVPTCTPRSETRRVDGPGKGTGLTGLWAPEIHSIDGRWYIYFAASDGNNANHRVFVLVSDRQDPFRGLRTARPALHR